MSDTSSVNGDGHHEADGWGASTSGQYESNGWDANGRSTHHHDDPYDGGYGYGQPSSSAYRYDSPYDNEPSYDDEPAWRGHESYQQEAMRASVHEREHLAPGEPAPSYGREDVESAISSNPLFTPQFMNVLQVGGARGRATGGKPLKGWRAFWRLAMHARQLWRRQNMRTAAMDETHGLS